MKATKVLLISALFAIVLFENCSIFIAKTAATKAEYNPIYYYGEQIYTRENCSSCHYFNIREKIDGKVSLDGVGSKYSNAWLYYYFFEPSSVYPASEKNSYHHLYKNEIDHDLLSKIIKKNYKEQDSEKLKVKFSQELDEIKIGLAEHGIDAETTEILSLIAFIQDIPKSAAKDVQDSLEKANEDKRIASIINEVLSVADDNYNIAKGKLLFMDYCAVCHGDNGQGFVGPNHTDEYWLHGGKRADIAKSIYFGVPNRGMVAWGNQLSTHQIGELVAFVYSLKGSNPDKAKEPQGIRESNGK